MKINYILAALMIAVILAISGCTSPSPSPAPGSTVSPTIVPTSAPVASPASSGNATPTAAPSTPTASSALTSAGNMTVSGISIDWDTTGILQQDTAHLTLQSTDPDLIQDVTVTYTVSTPTTVANVAGPSTTSSESKPVSVYVGKISPTEVKNITLPGLAHAKNVPETVTFNVSWKGGQATVLRATFTSPDGNVGTQKF